MRKQIIAIWNGSEKICETTDRKEIKFYRDKGYTIVKTGSYVRYR